MFSVSRFPLGTEMSGLSSVSARVVDADLSAIFFSVRLKLITLRKRLTI